MTSMPPTLVSIRVGSSKQGQAAAPTVSSTAGGRKGGRKRAKARGAAAAVAPRPSAHDDSGSEPADSEELDAEQLTEVWWVEG